MFKLERTPTNLRLLDCLAVPGIDTADHDRGAIPYFPLQNFIVVSKQILGLDKAIENLA